MHTITHTRPLAWTVKAGDIFRGCGGDYVVTSDQDGSGEFRCYSPYSKTVELFERADFGTDGPYAYIHLRDGEPVLTEETIELKHRFKVGDVLTNPRFNSEWCSKPHRRTVNGVRVEERVIDGTKKCAVRYDWVEGLSGEGDVVDKHWELAPYDYKFQVGDRIGTYARHRADRGDNMDGSNFEVLEQITDWGSPAYRLRYTWGRRIEVTRTAKYLEAENELTPAPVVRYEPKYKVGDVAVYTDEPFFGSAKRTIVGFYRKGEGPRAYARYESYYELAGDKFADAKWFDERTELVAPRFEPKFKVGDKIKYHSGINRGQVRTVVNAHAANDPTSRWAPMRHAHYHVKTSDGYSRHGDIGYVEANADLVAPDTKFKVGDVIRWSHEQRSYTIVDIRQYEFSDGIQWAYVIKHQGHDHFYKVGSNVEQCWLRKVEKTETLTVTAWVAA